MLDAETLSHTHSVSWVAIQNDPGEAQQWIASVAIRARHGVMWMSDWYVIPSYRGNGLGRQVMQRAIKLFNDHWLYLVAASGEPAINHDVLVGFYQTLGFAPVLEAPGVMRRAPRE